jgi:hypothetical protein
MKDKGAKVSEQIILRFASLILYNFRAIHPHENATACSIGMKALKLERTSGKITEIRKYRGDLIRG